MTLIDTNVILRHLLDDPPDQAAAAHRVIENGAYTTMEVIAEVVYVLQGVYRVDRESIADTLEEAMSEIAMPEPIVLWNALELYRVRSLDFVDCVLAARAVVEHAEVFTFDRKLDSLIEHLTNK